MQVTQYEEYEEGRDVSYGITAELDAPTTAAYIGHNQSQKARLSVHLLGARGEFSATLRDGRPGSLEGSLEHEDIGQLRDFYLQHDSTTAVLGIRSVRIE